MHSVLQIADAFIRLGIRDNKPLTHLQVQKLCFLAQGYSLAVSDEPIFKEDIKAWPYGPVIPYLYSQLKRYGRDEITDTEPLPVFPIKDDDKYTNTLIEFIYARYGDWTGSQLSNLTHLPNTPWDIVWHEQKFSSIPNELIQDFYKSDIKELLNAESSE